MGLAVEPAVALVYMVRRKIMTTGLRGLATALVTESTALAEQLALAFMVQLVPIHITASKALDSQAALASRALAAHRARVLRASAAESEQGVTQPAGRTVMVSTE
jgi:hypothetical protein